MFNTIVITSYNVYLHLFTINYNSRIVVNCGIARIVFQRHDLHEKCILKYI